MTSDLRLWAAVLVGSLVLAGCGGDSGDGPEGVAKGYVDAALARLRPGLGHDPPSAARNHLELAAKLGNLSPAQRAAIEGIIDTMLDPENHSLKDEG